jgi:hypothetical protein
MISKILRKNTSPGRIVGFILSNFIGLAIVLGGLQFYGDANSIWSDSGSFIRTDYLVVNKKVTSANTLGQSASGFSETEIADIEAQPWTRSVGRFTANDFRVNASLQTGSRGMSTYMFFESIPDDFIDVPRSQWQYRPGSGEVPIILSKDYLTLYNFGFASSAGLPQLSEGLMSSIPLTLTISSDDGSRTATLTGRVAGFSNRLNTILVPEAFMQEANARFSPHAPAHTPTPQTASHTSPKRLIIDVSSPGDVAIKQYLDSHDLELAGDKSASSAAFLLKIIVAIVLTIGIIITLLSLFILILSISLIMEKNRDKLHALLMLGYPVRTVQRPYSTLVAAAATAAMLLAIGATYLLRTFYITPLKALGATSGGTLTMLLTALILTLAIIVTNLTIIKRRVKKSFRQ